MANIRIDDEQMRLLKEYEAKTGVRAAKCVQEAVESWLVCSAPVRLEALGQEPLTGLEEMEAAHIKKHRVRGPEAVTMPARGQEMTGDPFQGRTEFPLMSVACKLGLTQDQASNLRMLGSGVARIRGNSVRPRKGS